MSGYGCLHCGEKFDNYFDASEHIREVHGNQDQDEGVDRDEG